MEFLQIAILHLLPQRLNNTCEEVQFLVKLYERNVKPAIELVFKCFRGNRSS